MLDRWTSDPLDEGGGDVEYGKAGGGDERDGWGGGGEHERVDEDGGGVSF